LFEKDLKIFFKPPFGKKIKVTSGRLKDKFINGIFDTGYKDMEFGKMQIATDSSVLLCITEQIKGLKEEDTLLYDRKKYMISSIQPDHTGLTMLDLAEEMT